MHEVVNLILANGNSGVSTVKACTHVAELVQAEVRLRSHARHATEYCSILPISPKATPTGWLMYPRSVLVAG